MAPLKIAVYLVFHRASGHSDESIATFSEQCQEEVTWKSYIIVYDASFRVLINIIPSLHNHSNKIDISVSILL